MAEMELQRAHLARDYELQSSGPKKASFQGNDEQQFDVLARLGKLPVLKVASLSCPEKNYVELTFVAQLRFRVNPGFYVYDPDQLGSCLYVRGTYVHRYCANGGSLKHIRRPYLQVGLAKALVFSDHG